jgi:hypothetical protein
MKQLQGGKKDRFIALYNDPESATFGNAYKSALAVGFTDSYARTITSQAPQWFVENCRHGELMELAEEKLKHFLTLKSSHPQVMKIQQDTAKFVSSSLGKEKYSTRSEVRTDSERKSFNPQTKLIVEKILDDFLQPKETRMRIEQTLN